METNTQVLEADNQPTVQAVSENLPIEELRRLTNEEGGWEKSGEKVSEEESQTPTTLTEVETEEETLDATIQTKKDNPMNGKAESSVPEDLKDTPYKNWSEMVKGYKNLQGELTRTKEKSKGMEKFADKYSSDSEFKQYMEQAIGMYENPQLAQAYLGTQTNQAVPDPRNFDLYSDDGLTQYNTELGNYMARQLDTRINSRFKEMDYSRAREKSHSQLKEAFPEANADEVEKFINERSGKWSLSDVYKVQNYENLKQNLSDKIRKDMTSKIETASKSTPISSGGITTGANAEDIVKYIVKHGSISAKKKYGGTQVSEAQREYTNDNY